MKVGVVGLGRMGSAMAVRLLAAGHDLAVYDPVPAATVALGEQGARVDKDLAGLCHDREVVLTMLPTDEIFEKAVTGPGGLADSLPAGAVHMVSGTHGLPLVDRMAELHASKGQILIVANVLGRPERAQSGSLGFITGGPQEVVTKLQPLLDVLGASFIHAGETPASAVVCKLANSFVLGCSIEATGEGMSLVRKYGVKAEVLYRVLTEGLFDCVAYRAYGDVIAKEDWERVGANIHIGLKDTDLAFEAAEKVGVRLPSGEVYREHLLAAKEKGEAELDWSVMAREQFRRVGLE